VEADAAVAGVADREAVAAAAEAAAADRVRRTEGEMR
jgi:hypothetical protein